MTHPSATIRVGLLAIALTAAGFASATVGASESEAAVDYQGYIAKAAKAATASKKKYGVPRAVTIAQSILESGWGRSGLSDEHRNYFGIKCGTVASPHQKGCVSLASYEYIKGKKKKYVSKFRTYASMERSFLDHGRLLNRADRYNPAFKHPNDPDKFIRAVHKAGYATDPDYSKLVIRTMKQWNLYRFDAKPKPKNKKPKAKPGKPKQRQLITVTLKQGNRNVKVVALQNLLVKAGHNVRTTGYFGTNTVAAVKAFQRKHRLAVTGRANPLTLTRLTPDMRKGSKGNHVVAMHTLLTAQHYKVNKGSSFGAKTDKAVKTFQKKNKLPQTGIVSVRTWGKLFG